MSDLHRCGEPGIAGEGGMAGVDGLNAVIGGTDQVRAGVAVSGEVVRVCSPRRRLGSFRAFEGLLAGIVCPGYGEVAVKVQTWRALSWSRLVRLTLPPVAISIRSILIIISVASSLSDSCF
jgi:hypothetical protein